MNTRVIGPSALLMIVAVLCLGCPGGGPAADGGTGLPPNDGGGQLDGGSAGDGGAVDDGGVPGDAGASLASSYCERIVDFFCPFYLRCDRMAVADVETCRDVFLESCNAKYERRYVDLESAGLLTLDLDGIETCRSHLESVACEAQPMELEGPCSGMWAGDQGAGEQCGFDVESFVCDADSSCVLGLDLCGTCRPLVGVGDACGIDVSCPRTADCVDGVCVARPTVGEACGGDGPGCAFGTYCVESVCTPPTYVGLGEACGGIARCPYKSACVGGTCQASSLLGEACGAGGCASGQCVDGACEPFFAVGDPCTAGYECASGMCDGVCLSLPSACIEG